MPLATFKSFEKKVYKKTEYVDFTLGIHQLRILDENAMVVDVHFLPVQQRQILCLGKNDCPICQHNSELVFKHGKEGYKHKEYNRENQQAYVNVLDRTLVKICPNEECEKREIKAGNVTNKFPPVCPKCGASIVNVPVTPLNKIKVFQFGQELNSDIEVAEASTLDDEGTPVGLLNFDVKVVVTVGSNGKKKKSAQGGRVDLTPEYEGEKFDLTTAIATFTPTEIKSLLSGVSMKDIYAGRKAEATVKAEEKLDPEAVDQMNADIAGLFNN
jgi:hypothetical protein